jgi:two-component system sensor kinase FixL
VKPSGNLGEFCLLIGLAASLFSLLGWLAGAPWLSGFGIAYYPDWPLSAVANGALAIALLGIARGHVRASRRIICIPLLIGVGSLAEYGMGISLGLDNLLFGSEVRALSLPTPGRPGVLSTISILLLSALAAILPRSERWADQVSLGLIGVTIGLASISMLLLLLGVPLANQGIRLTSSLPASIALIAMAVGALAWRTGDDGPGLVLARSPEWRRARIALPIILILPAILLPIQVRFAEAGILPPPVSEIAGSIVNLLLMVMLLTWAVARIAEEGEALRESERRVALATEVHGVGIFDWDLQTNALTWTPGAEQQLGLDPGTIRCFADWLAIVPPEDAEAVADTIRQVAARKAETYSFRYRIRRADGTIHMIEGSARAFYNEHGKLVRSLGINIDVTGREAREAALQASEEQLRLILQTVPDAMVIIDDHGTIRSFSAAAERMFGYESSAVVGANVSMLMPATQAMAHDGYLERYRETGKRHIIGNVRILTARRADGSEIPIELNVGEARIGDERLFTGFIRDISQRVAAQEHLEAVHNEYARSARLSAMGEIAAGLAHELNQPLAATANFLGTAELLLAKVPAAAVAADQIASANGQIQRAGEIIRRLRDFIAKGEVDMRAEPLEPVVREAVALGLIGSLQFKIRLDYKLDPGAATMIADRIQIQQVLVNLLRNAAEAVRCCEPERRVIEIAAQAISEDMMEISVSDSGAGLSDEVMDQLYTPFLSTKGEAGLGIGLSICRRIVEAHGGTISATNRSDVGARIAFTLPRLDEREDAPNEA